MGAESHFDTIASLGLFACTSLFALISYVVFGLSMGRILERVGRAENKILAWIPFVNVLTLPMAARVNLLTVILIFIPIVNLIYYLYLSWKIGNELGVSPTMNLLALIVNVIFPPFPPP